MQNYLSIGVDALVTYNFHKARESPFYVMSSRLINKFIYFSYGTKDVLERECRNLNKVHKHLGCIMGGGQEGHSPPILGTTKTSKQMQVSPPCLALLS